MKSRRIIAILLALAAIITAAILGRAFWLSSKTIFDLLNENRKLRSAISNLTAESQIGVAKVVSQTSQNGHVQTRVLFVETARDDPKKKILEQEYTIDGDVVHFDAVIVKFNNSYVEDGKARALYLWRRIFGETMSPQSAFPIEKEGQEPKRYAEILSQLSIGDRNLFWSEIWKLSANPDRLKSAGIQAVYGNDLYTKLAPGFLYIFKIGNAGQFYVETVPSI